MRPTLALPLIDHARTRRVLELLLVLWVLAMADLFFTIWAQIFTPFTELNPVASHLLTHDRFTVLIAGKVGLTAIGTAIFWGLRKHRPAELALWLVVMCYVALTFRWSDYTSQILALGVVGV